MSTTQRPTRAQARQARARAARAAIVRMQQRRRRIRIGAWSAGAAALVLVLVLVVVALEHSAPPPPLGPTATAGAVGRTIAPPWPAPTDVSAAARAAGLPLLGAEGTALHIHAHLDVIINGVAVPVPADIGVDDARQQISPLHTHDTTGVIHIESPTATATFTLGQFFAEWDVALAADRIGGLVADPTHRFTVYVDGTVRAGDPKSLVLAAHAEIALVYGATAASEHVPSSYVWTNGL